MAKVYHAVDLRLRRDVAVKVINPKLRTDSQFDARYRREAQLVSQLFHPHIVVVHDFGIDPQCGPYLVMELLIGKTLREQLNNELRLFVLQAIELGKQLFQALTYAHDKGIVHRDIKPENLFIIYRSGLSMHLRVLDFGVARICRGDEGGHAASLTQPGAIVGTARYMSPEQLAGNPADTRSDLYSAALVMHEALGGKLPFLRGKPLIEVWPYERWRDPVALQSLYEELQSLLENCLSPNPTDRPADAMEAYRRLQDLGKKLSYLFQVTHSPNKMAGSYDSPSQDASTVDYAPPPRSGRMKQWLCVLGIVAAVTLAVWTLFWIFTR
jgi:serine/threonine-protein kinase